MCAKAISKRPGLCGLWRGHERGLQLGQEPREAAREEAGACCGRRLADTEAGGEVSNENEGQRKAGFGGMKRSECSTDRMRMVKRKSVWLGRERKEGEKDGRNGGYVLVKDVG